MIEMSEVPWPLPGDLMIVDKDVWRVTILITGGSNSPGYYRAIRTQGDRVEIREITEWTRWAYDTQSHVRILRAGNVIFDERLS